MPTPLVVGSLDVLLPVLTRMINLSLESGVFPENWKQADVSAYVGLQFTSTLACRKTLIIKTA